MFALGNALRIVNEQGKTLFATVATIDGLRDYELARTSLLEACRMYRASQTSAFRAKSERAESTLHLKQQVLANLAALENALLKEQASLDDRHSRIAGAIHAILCQQ